MATPQIGVRDRLQQNARSTGTAPAWLRSGVDKAVAVGSAALASPNNPMNAHNWVGPKPEAAKAAAPAPAGGIGVRQGTPAPAGAAQPGVSTALPTFQPTAEVPKVPAPASAQVGVKDEGHPDSPVKAPAAQQAAPYVQPRIPYNVADMRLRADQYERHVGNPQAPSAFPGIVPANTPVTHNPQTGPGSSYVGGRVPIGYGEGPQPLPSYHQPDPAADARMAAYSKYQAGIDKERTDLYKQHHGGWSKGEYEMLAAQGLNSYGRHDPLVGAGPPALGQQRAPEGAPAGGIGLAPTGTPGPGQPGAVHPNGSPNVSGDAYRDRLTEKMNNPGFDRQGGIAVYSGGATEGSPSTAERNALTSVTAQNQRAAYDMTNANIRGIDGEVRNRDPRTAVDAELGALKTPEGRALAEGQNQMAPGSIPTPAPPGGPPIVQYNGTNVGPQDKVNPNVQGLHNILHGDMPLHSKVAAAAMIPGIETPGSPHRELFDAWVARQSTTDQRWAHDVSQYGNTGQSAEHKLSDHGWLGRNLFGVTGTGPVQARNQKFHADMARLGYKFHAQ